MLDTEQQTSSTDYRASAEQKEQSPGAPAICLTKEEFTFYYPTAEEKKAHNIQGSYGPPFPS